MFRGIHAINLDAKGRFAVPSRHRPRLQSQSSGQLVVTIDTEEKCLLLYPLSEWEPIERKVGALSSFNQVTRRIQRLLLGHATEVELDGNGRILLPALLRQYANVDKKMMLVGQGKKFEIWSESSWQTRCEAWLDEAVSGDDMPEELGNLSL